MSIREWALTNKEIAQLQASGGDVVEAQEAKKQAYIKAGGIILNPDALEDLYEFAKQMERSGLLEELPTWLQGLRNIIVKAEEK